MPTRRDFLTASVRAALAAGIAPAWADLPAGTLDSATSEALAGKRPLIKHSYRPPNFETPVAALGDVLTPNDAFFVRWHLANIPVVDAASWTLAVGGDGARTPFTLSLADLKRGFEAVDVVAVCQCAGARRGLVEPHVPGVEWGNGAVGNARWRGVRLRDILARAGVGADAVEVAVQGSDRAPLEATPPFVKSIPLAKALHEHTLVAWEMNGRPLPHWNGAPVRLVVPGWVATYWMKQLASIRVLNTPLDGFWMKSAYRIPRNAFPTAEPFATQQTDTSAPITEILVNSLITSHAAGARVALNRRFTLAGVAWDRGTGIRSVAVSVDGGTSWQPAALDRVHGPYSFRRWTLDVTPRTGGPLTVLARAQNEEGLQQPFELVPTPGGYHNNIVQPLTLEVA